MKIKQIIIISLFILSIFQFSCNAQEDTNKLINRKPAVAGKFYPLDKKVLKDDLKQYFALAKPLKAENVIAIISPHAGYVFSGEVAASAFNQINTKKKYKRIFLIGPSHYVSFNGASIYNIGNYGSPLGEVKVDLKLANELIKKNKIISYHSEAHEQEHCLETQIPFLQYRLNYDFKIIPVIIGTQSEKTIIQIASVLKPYFNSENLFIISSDFSHFPNYDDANNVDKLSGDAILKNSTEKLIKQVKINAKTNTSNLVTSMCGYSAILTLLHMTKDNKNISYNAIQYKNSGDSKYGGKDRVVGYYAFSITEKATESSFGFNLNKSDKETLLKIARSSIVSHLNNTSSQIIDTNNLSTALKTPCGAFVTLNKEHKLRGCIGNFSSDLPLYKVVQNMAIAAATQDPRFNAVSANEIKILKIEISVLTPMKKINSVDDVEAGKHGIYIKKGYRKGTLLPQVATNNNWTNKEFVNYCAQYKAGISLTELKDAELYVYEAIVFEEE
ncbi:MAG: TIGR00296 family protein [Bacteroidetes bacterium]|nr:MAG: TIGR00296 family protein [Bacteroidota bacterium]